MDHSDLILIVDDNLFNLTLLSRVLEDKYKIKVAMTSMDALRLAEEQPRPNLILLDIMMPDIDGYEVCRRLKQNEETCDIPVIFVTTLSSDEDEAKGLSVGAVDFITRPIRKSIIHARVKTHLQLGQLLKNSKSFLLDTSDQLVKETVARFDLEWSQRRLQELNMVILRLLETAMQPMTLQEQLDSALNIMGTVPWLMVQSQGAIFLAETDGTLVLTAQTNLPESMKNLCARVASGQCLCGQAAETQQIIHLEHVDKAYPCTTVDHIPNTIPLIVDNRLIGVLLFQRPLSHTQSEEERLLIEELSKVLGEIISRRLLDAKFQVSQFELEGNQEDIIRRLGMAAEFRDNETGMHIVRMSHYAASIAETIGMSEEDQKMLLLTAPMHDVGKIGIPDSILLKEGRLTDEEFNLIKTHTTIGGRILLGHTPILSAACSIALSHHEKWDGTGYPKGLSGNDIPIFGRICAIADVFDALTMARPYKKSWPIEEATNLIREQSGKHFDPQLVEAFFVCLSKILMIKAIYPENSTQTDNSVFLRPLRIAEEDSPLWNAQYEIGDEAIDKQHRILFSLIDRLEDVLQKRQAVIEICKVLRELESYVYIHFSDEERFMLRHEYKNYVLHKEQHANFEKKISEFWKAVRENPVLTGTNIIVFLREWLVTHIIKEDMDLKKFVQKKPIHDSAVLRDIF